MPLGTGTGIISIVLSALRAALLGDAPHEGRFFATDLGRCTVPRLSPYSQKETASAMPILSHNIESNAKHFTQPQDSPQPLALNWDEENLPEQVAEAGGFDVILCVSSSGLD